MEFSFLWVKGLSIGRGGISLEGRVLLDFPGFVRNAQRFGKPSGRTRKRYMTYASVVWHIVRLVNL